MNMTPSATTTTRYHWLIVCASIVIILAGIKTAATVIVPFILAIFLAVICSPLVQQLTQWKIPRGLAICTVLAVIVVLLFTLAGVVGSSINRLGSSIPVYREQIEIHLRWLANTLSQFNIHISFETILEYFDPGAIITLATNILTGFSGIMANFFLILLVVLLMLFEAPSMPNRIHVALADPQMRQSQIDRFLDAVKHYMAIKTVISLMTGICISLFLWWMQVEFYILWGVLAFLLNYIPNVGSIIAAIPPILLAIIQLSLPDAMLVAGFYLVLNVIIGQIIEPRVMGNGLGLSTLVVFLSLIFWGWLLGSVGMLLSVPLTMILKIGLENSQDGVWLSHLLSNQTAVNKSE